MWIRSKQGIILNVAGAVLLQVMSSTFLGFPLPVTRHDQTVSVQIMTKKDKTKVNDVKAKHESQFISCFIMFSLKWKLKHEKIITIP